MDEFRRLLKTLSGHSDVDSAEMEKDAVEALEVMTALEGSVEELAQKPKPFVVPDFFKLIDTRTEKALRSHAKIRSHIAGFKKLAAQRASQILEAKSDWFRDRDGISGKFKDAKLPKSVSKVVADAYTASLTPPEPLGLAFTANPEKVELRAEDVADLDYWSTCRVLKAFVQDSDRPVNEAVTTWVEQNKKGIADAMLSNRQRSIQTGR